ncbi:MAG: hypothetical protein Q9160_007748, partial [Pyrenula sp. 1 TL-2023]
MASTMAKSADNYPLPRDYLDNTRINLQHFVWREVYGYTIHQKITSSGSPLLRIADVGTGTAYVILYLLALAVFLCQTGHPDTRVLTPAGPHSAWLIYHSSRLPNATLDGLDISLDSAPAPAYLPSNVHLRQWDAKTEPPDDLVGQYDMIHVRLFVWVAQTASEAEKIVRNLVKLL